MSETKVRHAYSWLPLLIIVMTVVTLAIGGTTLRYIETRMVAIAGKFLALTAAEVSDKLDRFLSERYGDVLMMAETFSAEPHNREFQSAYVARATAPITGRGTDGEARHLAGDGAAHILSRGSGVATAAPGQNGQGPGRAQLDLGAARCEGSVGPLITMKEYA